MRRIEIQTTEHSKVYAKVEGCLFSIGHISDLRDVIPDHNPKDCKPFFTRPCIEPATPGVLYELYLHRLEIPEPWTWGNEVMGLNDRPYSVPTCPTCEEVTYSEPRCPFCGQALKDPNITGEEEYPHGAAQPKNG